MKTRLTPVIEKRGDWFIAYIEEVPGVNTQGKTFQEACRNLYDAPRMVKFSQSPNRKCSRKS
jgi:predicted RNase H-like HicB family nuclease